MSHSTKRSSDGKRTDPVQSASSTRLNVLLTACARGDVAAFARFYQLTSPQIYTRVLHVVPDRKAETVLVAVYVAVWSRAASFASAPSQSVWGWLSRLVGEVIHDS